MKKVSREFKRGDIVFADLSPVVGSEQGGLRPVIIIQNNVGNSFSPTVIVAAISSQMEKCKLPTHVLLPREQTNLKHNSVILLEQIRTIDKHRFFQKAGSVSKEVMDEVDNKIKISLGLDN